MRKSVDSLAVWGLTALLALLAWTGSARADEAVWPESAVLGAYLEEGARANPGLQAAFARFDAALEKVPQARAWPDPRLSFGVFVVPVETRTGPQRMKYGVSQRLPWFGKRDLKAGAAELEAGALLARAREVKLTLFRDIGSAYFEYAYLGRAIGSAREELELLKFFEALVEAKYAVSSASYADLTRIQVERARAEERIASLEDYRLPLSERLRTLLGRSAGGVLPMPASLPMVETTWDEARIMTAIGEQNQALAALDARAGAADAAEAVAAREFYPDLTVGVESVYTDAPRMPGVVNEGRDPVALTFGINLPLDLEARQAAVRQARKTARAARLERADRAAALEAQASRLFFGLRDTARRLELLSETIVPKARQNLDASVDAYQAGPVSMTDLLSAEKILVELELQYQRVLADQAVRLAELDVLAGQELPRKFLHVPTLAGTERTRELRVELQQPVASK
jgi:outer membrane protein TolC